MQQNDTKTIPKWLYGLILLGLSIAIILPRALDLTRYTTIDEGLWLFRSANFYYALGQREFEYTHQSEHPGVTTMWAGAAGYHLEFPEYRGLGQGYMAGGKRLVKFLETTEKTPIDLLVAGRWFMILGTTVILLASFVIIQKIIGFIPTILGFFLIALEPFHIGLTNILHLDGMLSGWMLLSAVALIMYVFLEQKPIYFLISAIAGACCLLTKTPGIFMIPYTGLLLLIRYLEEKPYHLKNLFTHIIIPLTLWILIAILVFVLLWPAMWVNPINTLQDISRKMGGYIEGREIYKYDEETHSMNSLGMGWYPITLLWRNTPVILIGFFLALIGFILKWGILKIKSTRIFAVNLFLLAFFFLITMGLGDQKADRYILPVYPPIILISALGWVAVSEKSKDWLQKKSSPAPARLAQAAILICLVGLQLAETIRVHPYYYTYYNPLMGGPEQASKVLLFGWGEGLDQVAAYIETQPNPEELTVMLPGYAYGPLSFYLSGTAIRNLEQSPEYIDELDYIVVYIIQIQNHSWLARILEHTEPEFVVTINELEYARIYNVKDIPPEYWVKFLPDQ